MWVVAALFVVYFAIDPITPGWADPVRSSTTTAEPV